MARAKNDKARNITLKNIKITLIREYRKLFYRRIQFSTTPFFST